MQALKRFVTSTLFCGLIGLTSTLYGQSEIGQIMRDRSINWQNPTSRAQAVQQIKRIEQRELQKARKIAKQRGKPLRVELANGKIRELVGLDRDGELLYYETRNTNAAISTGADQLRVAPYSLDGSGLLVGVWDGGSVLSTHQEFNDGATSRINIQDGAASNYHATHVGGTIGAYGTVANARGMVHQATIESYDWFSDIGEMTGTAATSAGQFGTKVYLSNHSYGFSYGWRNDGGWIWTGTGTDQNAYDADFGQYSGTAANLDSLIFNSPYYLAFWAAGNENNDGPNNGNTVTIGGTSGITYDSSIHPQNDGDYSGGFDTIGDHGVAKNLMTIGAANDAVTSGQRDPSKSTIASFSSTGPVDDGRIKPDLVANGVGLYSTDNGNDTDYRSLSGTSMASPNATASAALLVDLYRDLFGSSAAMRASTLKGLLIHTASDIGNPGPDYTYGWGLVDVKTAADLLDEAATYPDKLSLVEDQLNTSTPTQTYNFFWDGTSEVRATLCWTDPASSSESAHNDRTPDLVNDLNVKLIAPDGTEHFPFVMPFVGTWTVASMSENASTGVNNTDNVEQVLIDSPAQTGEWTIEVSYTGSLTNNLQDYGLIVTGSSFNPGGTVGFSSDNYTVDENAGTATITVDRLGGNTGAISVDYTTTDGTATFGSDYTSTTGTLNWADGDSASKTFTATILDDTVHEDPEETLSLTLLNPVDAEITGTNPATLTIIEDDNQVPSLDAGADQKVFLSGTVWSPNSLSPDLWLDAGDSNTLTLNGSTVSQWNDKSGNNRHATQATTGAQPTLTNGVLNGRNVLTFDGGSDFFNVDLDFMAGVDHSVFVVTKPTTYTNIYGAANGSAGANSLHVGFRSSSSYRMNYWGNDWNRAPTNFQAGTANLLNYVWLSGTTKEIFANGKSEGTNNSAGIVGTMSGGGRISNVTSHGYYGGDIAEFIAFGKSLTLTERQELEGFLAHKWGMANLLASGHPYKSASPDNNTASATLDGTVSDSDGDPLTTTWSVVSGPASVTFVNASAVDTAATFTTAGTYTLRLTADDGYTTTSDDILITVFEEGAVTYTVDFQTDGTAGASLTGDISQTIAGGGDATSVTANAPVDYHLVEWTESGTSYSAANPLTVTNVTSNMTLVANFTKSASIAMSDDGSIVEQSEDGEAILVTLTDGTFADPITPANWSLSGEPGGVSKGTVTRISDTSVRILFSGNSTTDYDSDIANMSVTCTAAEVVNAVSPLSANSGVTFTASNDAESIEISDDGWIQEGAEDGELITVLLNGGTFAASLNGANWTVSNLPSGVSQGAVSRVSDYVATIALSGNASASYGGSDITNVTVSCSTAEFNDSTGDASLSDDSGVTLRALASSSTTLQDGLNSYTGTSDTYIDYSNPDTNYGTATTLQINNRTNPAQQKQDKHGFLYFDLSSIPAGTGVSGVTVDLIDDGGDIGTFRLYEATGSWSEAGATYNNSSGLLGVTDYANASAPGTAGTTVSLVLNAAGIAKVQEWIDNAASNNGFTIQTDLTDNSIHRFRTSEHATQANRPKITITYESGATSAPEINLQGNGVSIVSGDTTPSTADHTDFGSTYSDGSTVTRNFTVQNVGDVALTLNSNPLVDITGTHAGDFSVTAAPATSSIVAGGSTTFDVTFTPGAAGLRSATISITSDDADETPYTFAIQGEGVTPPVAYSVTYNGNGNTAGTATADSLSPYESGATVIVLGSADLEKTGNSFSGWNTASDGTGTGYAPAASFTINADTTLYAQWLPNTAGYTLSKSSAIVGEAGGTDSFSVVLDSQPASDVVFDVTSSSTAEVTVSPTSLTFTSSNWNTAQDVTITGVDDSTTSEDTATVTVSVNAAASMDTYDTLSDQTVSVTCTNDDVPGITVGAISGDTGEGGTTANFSVVLNTQPVADVTIGLSSSDTGEGTVSPASLAFSIGDWNTPQTVTVTGADDALLDGDVVYSVVTGPASCADADYDGIDPANVSVTNLDNESVVSYNGNGNDGGSAPADQVKIHGTALTLSDAGTLTRTGYTFSGWNNALDGSSVSYATGASYNDEADVTLYAQWTIDTYTVSYEGNGNTAGTAPANQTKTYNLDLTLETAGDLVRNGYLFAGWNTSADGSGTDYAEGATYSTDADIALYAKWLLVTPPVISSLDPVDGATGVAANSDLIVTFDENIAIGTGNITIKNLTDVTQTVIDLSDGIQVSVSGSTLTINPTDDLLLGKDYAVRIDEGAITDLIGSPFAGMIDDTTWNFQIIVETLIFGESFEDPDVIDDGSTDPTGWDTVGHVNYVHISDENDTAPDFTSTPYGAQALTCYNGSDAYAQTSASILSETVSVGSRYILSFNVAALPGRSDAYYTATLLAIDGGGVETVLGTVSGNNDGTSDMSYSDSLEVTPTTNDGERLAIRLRHTVSASWQDKPSFDNVQLKIAGGYSVTYDGNGSDGGTVPVDGTSYMANDMVTVLGNTGSLFKVGHVFAGWNTVSDGSGTGYAAADTFTITENVTLFAQWTANQAPVADNQSVNTLVGTAVSITLTASDADDDSLAYTVLTQPANGTLSGTAPNLSYTPDTGYTGGDSFSFTANDGNVDSDAATVSITVISPFEDWAGEGSSPENDSNGDGIADGIAWVLGANDPSSNVTALLPTLDVVSDTDYMTFTYRRSDAAHGDSSTTIEVKYGSDLSSWTTAVHDGGNVIITETDDHYATGVDRVEVKLHKNLATDGKMFTRLSVVITP